MLELLCNDTIFHVISGKLLSEPTALGIRGAFLFQVFTLQVG